MLLCLNINVKCCPSFSRVARCLTCEDFLHSAVFRWQRSGLPYNGNIISCNCKSLNETGAPLHKITLTIPFGVGIWLYYRWERDSRQQGSGRAMKEISPGPCLTTTTKRKPSGQPPDSGPHKSTRSFIISCGQLIYHDRFVRSDVISWDKWLWY